MPALTATVQNGAYAPQIAIPSDAREVVLSGTTYNYLRQSDFANPTLAEFGTSRFRLSNTLRTNVTLPASFFGMHLLQQTNYGDAAAVVCGSARTHDSGLRWDQIETSSGVYDWTRMDAYVAAHSGRQIVYVLYGTPGFYSSDTGGTQKSPYSDGLGGYIKKIASPPTAGGLTALGAFITALVTRYLGVMQAIEVWNEPNSTNPIYKWWWGTQQELANLIRAVDIAAKAVDATIKTVAPATVGWISTGTAKAYIEATLALTAAGDASAVKNRINVFSAHLYGANNSTFELQRLLDNVAASQTALGLSLPFWDTEAGLLQLATGDDTTGYTDSEYHDRMFAHWITCFGKGCERVFWYAQDHVDMGFKVRPNAQARIIETLTALAGQTVSVYAVGNRVGVVRASDGRAWIF